MDKFHKLGIAFGIVAIIFVNNAIIFLIMEKLNWIFIYLLMGLSYLGLSRYCFYLSDKGAIDDKEMLQ